MAARGSTGDRASTDTPTLANSLEELGRHLARLGPVLWTRVLELRVQCVSGTPPTSRLGVSIGEVGQVAGDNVTGIYRARDGVKLLKP